MTSVERLSDCNPALPCLLAVFADGDASPGALLRYLENSRILGGCVANGAVVGG